MILDSPIFTSSRSSKGLGVVLACFFGSVGVVTAAETVLYQTDFSDFPLGDGQIVGHDGWLSTHEGQPVHGTIDDIFDEGNRSGTIGFEIPEGDTNVITLYRPLDYDPVSEEMPVIEFSATVAIFDSTDDFYDSFYISVYNTEAQLLASVVFDNTIEAFGIWRYDGEEYHDTLVGFDHSVPYELKITIDYETNQWSAVLGETVLFTDAPFTVSDARRDLGDFSVEWEITDLENPGTNWMFFDDWFVMARDTDPGGGTDEAFVVTQITRRNDGQMAIRWSAEPNTDYQVEASNNLTTWTTNLPGSRVTTGDGELTGGFIDRTAGAVGVRYYRVRRL